MLIGVLDGPCFSTFASSHGVNIPTIVNFKIMSLYVEVGGNVQNQLIWASDTS